MPKLIITSSFEKDTKSLAKKYPSLNKDLYELFEQLKTILFLELHLEDCYKIRIAIKSKGKGKSGGARVISCVKIVHDNVFLLKLYDKSEKETVDDKELTMLLEAAGLL